VQKVHWKRRWLAEFKSGFGIRGGTRWRRRSFFELLLSELKELRELRDPWDHAELRDWADPDEKFVKPVSKEVVEGARKMEKLPELPFESCLRAP